MKKKNKNQTIGIPSLNQKTPYIKRNSRNISLYKTPFNFLKEKPVTENSSIKV